MAGAGRLVGMAVRILIGLPTLIGEMHRPNNLSFIYLSHMKCKFQNHDALNKKQSIVNVTNGKLERFFGNAILGTLCAIITLFIYTLFKFDMCYCGSNMNLQSPLVTLGSAL